MMAHSKYSKPQIAQHLFGPVDLPQLCGRNRDTVRDAGTKAWGRRLVPNFQAQIPGQLSYLSLCQAGFAQRAAHTMFEGCTHSRSVSDIIFGVRPVGHARKE